MCGRCGCLRETDDRSPVRPAVVEGLLQAVLLVLLAEGDGYGYELAVAIEARGLLAQPVPPTRVYKALRQLADEGALRVREQSSPDGPDRRRYSITTAGRSHLGRWIESLRLTEAAVQTVLDAHAASAPEPGRRETTTRSL